MKQLLKRGIASCVDTVLPPRCVISGETVDKQGMIAPHMWRQLDFIHGAKCDACGFPFGFDVMEGSLCASCIDYPKSFDSARSALKYDDISRDLILGFKHGDQTHAARAFTPWLKAAGKDMLGVADCIVPVPLHRLRLIKRRYNQAAIMAQYLSKETGVPVLVDGLKRVRSTPPQGHMDTKARYRNVRKAFVVNPKRLNTLAGKTVILMDDVYTTGATVNECTKALKKAGVAAVHVLTLARVVKDGFG